MKLASFKVRQQASYGSVDGETISDLGAVLRPRYPTLRSAIAAGVLRDALQDAPKLPLGGLSLLPPIPDPDKIICVGLNYRAHAAEAGLPVPEFPTLFLRLNNTLAAHQDNLVLPEASDQFDFEGELALVIGKGGRHIARSRAMDHVFGYACFNDASIRDFQFKHCLTVGKNFPATGGFGPWIVTRDEVADPAALRLRTRLNGKEVQNGTIDDLIFDIPTIVEYVSAFTELAPGDVISTGTPHGVGLGRKPPLWMKAHDVIEVEISNIGVLRNTVVPETDHSMRSN